MMKKDLYFMLKALFVLKILIFLSRFFGDVGRLPDKKAEVCFKVNDITVWETITIHVLVNITKSKGNQTMKFGQLIKYSLRFFFLEESDAKCGGEAIPRSFWKSQNTAYL